MLVKRICNIQLDANRKILLENFLSLSVLQGANYIIPLITFPYLVRVLGPERFGLVMFAQAFIQYFNIFTDYGFNLLATREISINRENKEKVSEIFSSVMMIKVALLILSFLIMTSIVFFFEKFRKNWLIYYLTFGIVIGHALFPVWLFQGMEKMRYITVIEVGIKFVFLILVFMFIHNANDYWKVPLLNAIGTIIGGIISLFIVFRNFNIKCYILDLKSYFRYLKASTSLFLSQFSISLFNQANTLIGGLIFSYTLLGYYNAAEKLFTALRNIFGIVFRVLYPYYSRNKRIFSFSYFLIVILVSALISVFLFLSGNFLVHLLYGKEFDLTAVILRILSIALFFSGINIMLFTLWFLSNGFDKLFFWITTLAGFINVSSLLLLSRIEVIGVLALPLSVVVTEFFLFFIYLVIRILKVEEK